MAYKINLTNEQMKELEDKLSSEKRVKIYKRLQCIKLKNENYKNIELAGIFSVTPDTITDWLKIFLEKGFEGLTTLNYDGRKSSKLEPYNEEIIERTKKGEYSTVMELKTILKEKNDIEVSKSWLSKYIKKIRVKL